MYFDTQNIYNVVSIAEFADLWTLSSPNKKLMTTRICLIQNDAKKLALLRSTRLVYRCTKLATVLFMIYELVIDYRFQKLDCPDCR